MTLERFVAEAEVVERTTLSRTSIWRREATGDFPRRRSLGPGRSGWLEGELSEWLASRPKVELRGPGSKVRS